MVNIGGTTNNERRGLSFIVFVVIIGAWECGTIHDFVSNYFVQIPIINLSEQWNDPLIEYFDISGTGTPAIYLNNNDTTLERNYSFIETLLLENNANFEPCPMINSISPNISARDQNLDITISGTNVSFSQYHDDFSGGGWHEYSSFQLEHTITSDLIIGNINEDYDSTSQASVYIPNNAAYGMYNVKIYDYNSNSYIYLYNGFSVSECINPTAEINLLSTDYTYNSATGELLLELYFDNIIKPKSYIKQTISFLLNSNKESIKLTKIVIEDFQPDYGDL